MYTMHTSIIAAKKVTITHFLNSTSFNLDLRLTDINCFTITFNYTLTENICTYYTNQKAIELGDTCT